MKITNHVIEAIILIGIFKGKVFPNNPSRYDIRLHKFALLAVIRFKNDHQQGTRTIVAGIWIISGEAKPLTWLAICGLFKRRMESQKGIVYPKALE